jgi:hypothetical protein
LPQPVRNPRAKAKFFGAVMSDHSEGDSARPYSPLLCILLLLTTGIGVKLGAAIHLCQLAQSSC